VLFAILLLDLHGLLQKTFQFVTNVSKKKNTRRSLRINLKRNQFHKNFGTNLTTMFRVQMKIILISHQLYQVMTNKSCLALLLRLAKIGKK
jgi:hypothetical protein